VSTPPGERVGPYELVAPIGRGGMAEVFRARRVDGTRGADVALKRILPAFAGEPAFAKMFAIEAERAAALAHPHIVRVLDAGEGWLAMELVEGWSLGRVVAALRPRGRGAAPKSVVAVARAVAAALGYVHARGLVHRDVSPSNVLVGDDGSVKLCDFGIAKALDAVADELRTRTGALKGKIPYMSPEQASGLAVDARSDQFSLGAVVHELLTGRRLFDGAGDLATLALVRAAEVDPPSMAVAGVPRALDEVCLRLLARSPAERFPDCAAVERALADVAAALGAEGRRPPMPPRSSPSCGEKRPRARRAR
jgi:serine/threonine-protein kinase